MRRCSILEQYTLRLTRPVNYRVIGTDGRSVVSSLTVIVVLSDRRIKKKKKTL